MWNSLRFRLTAWYLLFFATLLAGFSMFLYTQLRQHLHEAIDTALLRDAATAVALVEDELAETKGDIAAAATEVISELRSRDTAMAVFEGGRLVATNVPTPVEPLASRVANGPKNVPFSLPGARAVAVQFSWGSRHFVLLAVGSLTPVERELHVLKGAFALVIPLTLLVAGVGGYLLAARSLAPLVSVSRQTARITERNLDERLHIGRGGSELALFAGAFNDLLSRLDRSFETMRRFVADASHELRTPLSVIRGEADVALSRDRSAEEYRESLMVMREEARRLSGLVEDLLNLARADAGKRPLDLQEFYLDDILQECCRSVQALAVQKRIALNCSCPEDVGFRGDPELFRRLVVNLLDNAIRYTPEGGQVRATLESDGSEIRIVISDTGIGIPAASVPHVFERFYRVDPARTRGEGGFGLGLSIAQWIAESHHGKLELSSTSAHGTTFTVSLTR